MIETICCATANGMLFWAIWTNPLYVRIKRRYILKKIPVFNSSSLPVLVGFVLPNVALITSQEPQKGLVGLVSNLSTLLTQYIAEYFLDNLIRFDLGVWAQKEKQEILIKRYFEYY